MKAAGRGGHFTCVCMCEGACGGGVRSFWSKFIELKAAFLIVLCCEMKVDLESDLRFFEAQVLIFGFGEFLTSKVYVCLEITYL